VVYGVKNDNHLRLKRIPSAILPTALDWSALTVVSQCVSASLLVMNNNVQYYC